MMTNYVKTAIRNVLRRRGYSMLNIGGLAVGMACCLLIFQYVAFEYSFDRFNENVSELYRVNWTSAQNEGVPVTVPVTGWAFGPAFEQEAPEVSRFTRLHPEYNNAIVSNPAQPDKVFEEDEVYYADRTFFEMFSYRIRRGDPGQALSEPGTVLLSESAANKYFGSEDPMGQVLEVAGWISGTFRVSGIFADVPANSHLQFDILLPMVDLLERSQFSDPGTGWRWTNFITYVQLRGDADLAEVERKFTDVLVRNREESFRQSNTTAYVHVQPLRDVHLNAEISAPKAVAGSYRTVSFFILIGVITLLVALVNYVNLATARALERAREVGVRKAIGAQRRQLVIQFLCESAFTNLMAVLLAGILAAALQPVVSDLVGASLTRAIWTTPAYWAVFLVVFCAATLLAGLYPAFVLSSFRPVAVLKGKAGSAGGHAWLRRGLIVFQFAAAIALLVGTAIVYRQLDFVRSMDLGIDMEQVLTVPSPRMLPEGSNRASAVEAFTQELRSIPAVQETATSFTVPGQGFAFYTTARRATADPSTQITVSGTFIDSSFARLYGLELVAGEGFANISTPRAEEEATPIITNETTARALGFDTPEEAVDEELEGDNRFRIVGIFKDFSWSSAHQERENAIFLLGRGEPVVSMRVSTENLPRTIAAIEAIYGGLFPADPFRYAFVDERFEQQYRNDQRFARLFSIFAGLAITIACLGLFGLASFTAQQRTKEIGVRKVLGASVSGIVALLSRDFLALVGVGFLVAAPPAYFIMRRWLENFAYRVDIGPAVFVSVGAVVLVIAVLAVSYQSVKAAIADPVESLRYE
jgi:putative ABC transport system permease protein